MFNIGKIFGGKKDDKKADSAGAAVPVCPAPEATPKKEEKVYEKKTARRFLYGTLPKKQKAQKTRKNKNVFKKQTKFLETSTVLLKPRLTEKAANLSSDNIYTFEVDRRATKLDVANAIKETYKVIPEQIKITVIQRKPKRNRHNPRVSGYTNKGKKAYVYLKKGDSIKLS